MTLLELLKDPKINSFLEPNDIRKSFRIDPNNIIYRDKETYFNKSYQVYEYYFVVKSMERHNYYYQVEVDLTKQSEIVFINCTCPKYTQTHSCKHLAAVVNNYYDLFFKRSSYNLDNISTRILEMFYDDSLNKIKKEVKVELSITLDNNYYYYNRSFINPKLTLGENKMYVLGNKINSFFQVYESKTGTFNFGKEFLYDPAIHYFTQEDEVILNAYFEYATSPLAKVKATKKLLSSLKNSKFILANYQIEGIKEGFPLNSLLTKEESNYKLKFDFQALKIIIDDDYEFVLYQGKLYHLNNKERELLAEIVSQNISELIITKENFSKFTKGLLNFLRPNMQIAANVDDIVLPTVVGIAIYFDIRFNLIKANPKFKYDDFLIDYFQTDSTILRNMSLENKVINDLLKYNFVLEKDCLELKDLDDQVYFLEQGLEKLASQYVIYTTEKFKNTTIKKKTNVSSLFRLGQDNIFNFNFNLDGIKSEELVNIFKSIKNKKKYYRLKNGNILSLEDEALQELKNLSEDLELTDEEIKAGKGEILKYRAIYLDSLKDSKYPNIIKTDNLFTKFMQNFYAYKDRELTLPKEELMVLRNYQLIGVKWLYNLAKTGFGGILADEMGLGKTIQVIYYIKQILQEDPQAIFLIVVPTSLAYNWDHEFSLYAPMLKRVICVGTKEKRKQILNNLNKENIIVTTYGLLREDEEFYMNLEFHTMIIDEAQNIKNYLTGIAKSVKKIKATTKFALTGTPLENSILELWSIFDFIMPGYLTSLPKFQNKYKIKDFDEDSEALIKGLNRQINPFILRRKKEEVTKELPEKLVNDIYIELSVQQKTLYVAELDKVKKEMEKIMQEEGINKARFMILQLLMKLRQICLDPAIIYENYEGNSNKIDTLLSIIDEYIKNNHKILVFSSFKTALDIVKKRLKDLKIKSYMIDGSVSSLNRVKMVDDFNLTDEVKVFLIMLKSGGTGLNLTKADVVIHLDLWWNPQAENQATDRAHRIGQTKNVEVIHLITKGTIEEKILALQNKKRLLADKIIDGEIRNQNLISSLTEEDIRNLLAYENKD